jgi:hypothetical protein
LVSLRNPHRKNPDGKHIEKPLLDYKPSHNRVLPACVDRFQRNEIKNRRPVLEIAERNSSNSIDPNKRCEKPTEIPPVAGRNAQAGKQGKVRQKWH